MSNNNKYQKLLQDYDKHCLRIAKATSINIHEKAKEKTDRIKHLEADYIRWFEYYFPNYAKKKSAWFHAKLASLIIKNKRLRLLAEMFRSAGKSVHIDMGIPLYLYLVKNDLKFMLLVGETDPKAKKLLASIQAQLQFNNRIKMIMAINSPQETGQMETLPPPTAFALCRWVLDKTPEVLEKRPTDLITSW